MEWKEMPETASKTIRLCGFTHLGGDTVGSLAQKQPIPPTAAGQEGMGGVEGRRRSGNSFDTGRSSKRTEDLA